MRVIIVDGIKKSMYENIHDDNEEGQNGVFIPYQTADKYPLQAMRFKSTVVVL